MIRILTDTSTLYSLDEGNKKGIGIVPLVVTINDKTYREFEEITPTEFIKLINEGHHPTSSQPAIGEMVELIEKYMDDDIIIISVADGLSGTYSSWGTAVEMSNHANAVVLNCKTLAFAQRMIVDEAVMMRDNGSSFDDIVKMVERKSNQSLSYLLPTDFNFLKRGGRLSPIAASMSGLLKIQPIVSVAKDGTTLEKFGVSRNFKIGLKKIFEDLKSQGINETHRFALVHSQFPEMVDEVITRIKEEFNVETVEVYELSCAFITHGGPKCLAIQVIE